MGASQIGQMYEIYINDSLLTLVATGEMRQIDRMDDSVVLRYRGNNKLLLNVLDNLEKSRRPRQIVLVSDDVPGLFRETSSLFTWIEAAGGIVENPDGLILAIYRRKRWDLPKGKLDPGETFEEAAVREVMEETGLKAVDRGPLIGTSMHVFKNRRGVRYLKLTKWYHMFADQVKLVWQREEDIEDARWISPEELLNGNYNIYTSIGGMVKQYLSMK